MAVHQRVTRVQNSLLALMERVRSGRHVGGWHRVAPVVAACGLPRVLTRAGMVLPRRFGWLVHLVGYQAAGRGSQLAHLLTDPEMVALLRDVPQARRIMAPLCRMLGVVCETAPPARRKPVRPRVAVAVVVPTAAVVERIDYRPSAQWPRGVIRRACIRLKPA